MLMDIYRIGLHGQNAPVLEVYLRDSFGVSASC